MSTPTITTVPAFGQGYSVLRAMQQTGLSGPYVRCIDVPVIAFQIDDGLDPFERSVTPVAADGSVAYDFDTALKLPDGQVVTVDGMFDGEQQWLDALNRVAQETQRRKQAQRQAREVA